MIKKAFLSTFVVGAIAAGIHAWIIDGSEVLDLTFILIYALLLVLTLGIYALLNFVKKMDPDKLGLAFIAGSPLKMLIAAAFLIPFILGDGENGRTYVIHFMIPYFVFFVVELYWVMRILRK